MRIGTVIGRVTLGKTVPALIGARWLILSPWAREQFAQPPDPPQGLGKEPSLVAYDALGGGPGHVVGYVEGREAAMPFDQPTPIDAINVALVDTIYYTPPA